RQRLDLFTANEADRPLLVFMHGGGFIAGDKYSPGTPYYHNIGVWAVRQGFNAVNITYRLAPQFQWPSGVEDIHRAIMWLKANGSDLGIGTDNIFLMGQSAGAAHVAGYIAHPGIYAPDAPGVKGIILVSGLYNFESMQVGDLERAYIGDEPARYAERSSIKGLVETDIPMLVTAAQYDPAFFEAQALELLMARQQKHQQMPEFVHLIGQNHISGILYLGLEGDLLGAQMENFIRENTGAGQAF
ncbi:MAG: alpha/beta hydrolase, partial [Pseudohongiellaceae bacterium]